MLEIALTFLGYIFWPEIKLVFEGIITGTDRYACRNNVTDSILPVNPRLQLMAGMKIDSLRIRNLLLTPTQTIHGERPLGPSKQLFLQPSA